MLALIVELRVKTDLSPEFLKAISTNAGQSISLESGCLRFDVLADPQDPTHFVLYELYEDHAAFDAHRRTAHFAAWREVAERCLEPVDGQRNQVLDVVASSSLDAPLPRPADRRRVDTGVPGEERP